jgi:protein SCO1/2
MQSSGSGYEGSELDAKPAPDFRLIDQRGRAVSLADLQGKVIVLTLLDPDCTDICPLYAYQFRLAHDALGEDAANVAFVAFNANNQKTAVEDVMAATRKWTMEEIPSWHFLTGTPEQLESVWKAYGLHASGRPKSDKPDELQHSPAVFILDRSGLRRWYLSTNFDGAPPLSDLVVKHVRALLDKGH